MAGTQFVELARDELLPVPLAPVMSTRASEGATVQIQLDNLADGRRIADDGGGAFGLDFARQPLGFLLKLALVEGVAHGQKDAVEVQRLLDEVKAPTLMACTAVSTVPWPLIMMTRPSIPFRRGHRELPTVHFGHFDVTKDHIKGKLGRQLEAFRTVLRFRDLVILVLEDFLQARSRWALHHR